MKRLSETNVPDTSHHRCPRFRRRTKLNFDALEDRRLLASLYVSPTGNDNNPGTLAAPFQSINAAIAIAQPADNVLIRGGTYRETITPIRSGTLSQPITIASYNGEAVYISASDIVNGPWTETSPGSGIFSTTTSGQLPALFWTGDTSEIDGNSITEQGGNLVATVVNNTTFSTIQARSVDSNNAWNFFAQPVTWRVRDISFQNIGITSYSPNQMSARFSITPISSSGYTSPDSVTVESRSDGLMSLQVKKNIADSWGTNVGSVTNQTITGFDLTLGPGSAGHVSYTLTAFPTNQIVTSGQWMMSQSDWSDNGNGSQSFVQVFAQESATTTDTTQTFQLKVGSYEIFSNNQVMLNDGFADGDLATADFFLVGRNLNVTTGYDQIFVNGQTQFEARYINKISADLLDADAAPMTLNSSYSLSGPAFSGKPADFFANARFIGRVGQGWSTQAAVVASSSAVTLKIDPTTVSTWWWPNFANNNTDSGLGNLYGKLEFLDTAREWHLQKHASGIDTLYLRVDGGANPGSQLVERKLRNWTINANGFDNLVFSGLNLRGGAIRLNGNNLVLQDSDAQYLSHFLTFNEGFHADGGLAAGGGVVVSGNENIVRRNTIYETAGSGVLLNGANHGVTDNLIRHVDYSGTYATGISMNGSGHVASYNTIHDSGRDILRPTGAGLTVMFNDLSRAGRLAHDLGAIYSFGVNGLAVNGQKTRIAYNWLHDRGDPSDELSFGIYLDNFSRNYIVDHNVIWNYDTPANQSSLKLNAPLVDVEVYNNTIIGSPPNKVTHTTYSSYPTFNVDPSYWNSSTHRLDYVSQNNLLLPAGTHLAAVFKNSATRDFRLLPGSPAIDPATITGLDQWASPDGVINVPADFQLYLNQPNQPFAYHEITGRGESITGITGGFLGSSPDDGAYEFGTASYWIAGRRASQATTPIPGNNDYELAVGSDLIFQPGLGAATSNIYFGSNASSVASATLASPQFVTALSAPSNIVRLADFNRQLNTGQEYFWRVDTRLTDGTVIPGDIWRFATDSNQDLVVINNNGAQNVTETSATIGGSIVSRRKITQMNDSFDDGNPGSNSNGIGNGFFAVGTANAVESGGAYRITNTDGSFTRRVLNSKQIFSFGSEPIEFNWSTSNLSVASGSDNNDVEIFFSVVSDHVVASTTAGHPWDIGEGGFWIELSANDLGSSSQITGNLLVSDDSNDSSNNANVAGLESFSFTHLDGQSIGAKLTLRRIAGTQKFAYQMVVTSGGVVVSSRSGVTSDSIVATDLLADELAGGVWTGVHIGNRDSGTAAINIDNILVLEEAAATVRVELWRPGQAGNFYDLGVQHGSFSSTVTGLIPGTTYFYRSHATDTFGSVTAIGVRSFTTAGAPTITQFIRDNDDLRRPDLWSSLQVVFTTDVVVSKSDFSLVNDTLNGMAVDLNTIAGFDFSYIPATFTATWSFADPHVLPAAFYTWKLNGATIASVAGAIQIDGDENGTAGGDFSRPVYVAIPGDANLDGDVDVSEFSLSGNKGDLTVVKANLGTAASADWSKGDFNGDGDVDVSQFSFSGNVGDLTVLYANLGRSVKIPGGQQSAISSTVIIPNFAGSGLIPMVGEPRPLNPKLIRRELKNLPELRYVQPIETIVPPTSKKRLRELPTNQTASGKLKFESVDEAFSTFDISL